jgi:DNA-binding CsgD family transcriptional regulator/PAS domain-containing protein
MPPTRTDPDDLAELFPQAPIPVAVVDMAIMELTYNDAFADLLGLEEAEESRPTLSNLVVAEDWPVVDAVLRGVSSGTIESCQGRGRMRPRGGGELPVLAWVRPFDGSRPCSRAVLAVVPADGAPPLAEPWFARVDSKRLALGSVDHEWRITEISPDGGHLLGWDLEELRGAPLQSVVHPDDVPLVLLTLGRSGSERRAVATRLRVRGADGWTPVRCAISPLCEHSPARFGFSLWLFAGEYDVETGGQRAAELEDRLWRIAMEVQAANIGHVPNGNHPVSTELHGLSERQSQIVRRLMNGERVPSIAQSLFLSQSTVRNHLSAIYRKLGVHSQSELLARVMGGHTLSGRRSDPGRRRPSGSDVRPGGWAVRPLRIGRPLSHDGLVNHPAREPRSPPTVLGVFPTPQGCSLEFSGAGAVTTGHVESSRRAAPWLVVEVLARSGRTGRPDGSAGPKTHSVTAGPVADQRSHKQVIVVSAPIPEAGLVAAFLELDSLGPGFSSNLRGPRDIESLVTAADGGRSIVRSIRPQR